MRPLNDRIQFLPLTVEGVVPRLHHLRLCCELVALSLSPANPVLARCDIVRDVVDLRLTSVDVYR